MLYHQFKTISDCYRLLSDERSREVFWARIKMDIAPSQEHADKLCSLCGYYTPPERGWEQELSDITDKGGKLILYGTSERGRYLGKYLASHKVAYYGFCGRRANSFPDGLLGKPVVSPEWLFAHASESYVIISATPMYGSYGEIRDNLQRHGFPSERILSQFSPADIDADHIQYFEFPKLIAKARTFIDAGSYDGQDCIRFAELTCGEKASIIAFEPDAQNAQKCRDRFVSHGLRNACLIQAALSDRSGKAGFYTTGSMASHMINESDNHNGKNYQVIDTVTLDEIVGVRNVGMIKMDIEGAEMAALCGAESVIRRDKPFLALAVYHRPGDIVEIMSYCLQLVPEYRFLLRQYGFGAYDTVLYASVNIGDMQKAFLQ